MSFVRSLKYDQLDEAQVISLKLGGNRNFKKFVQLYKLNHLESHDLFITRACQFYREKLEESVNLRKAFTVDQRMLEELSVEEGHGFIYDLEYLL